jgi:hypothetical protein
MNTSVRLISQQMLGHSNYIYCKATVSVNHQAQPFCVLICPGYSFAMRKTLRRPSRDRPVRPSCVTDGVLVNNINAGLSQAVLAAAEVQVRAILRTPPVPKPYRIQKKPVSRRMKTTLRASPPGQKASLANDHFASQRHREDKGRPSNLRLISNGLPLSLQQVKSSKPYQLSLEPKFASENAIRNENDIHFHPKNRYFDQHSRMWRTNPYAPHIGNTSQFPDDYSALGPFSVMSTFHSSRPRWSSRASSLYSSDVDTKEAS